MDVRLVCLFCVLLLSRAKAIVKFHVAPMQAYTNQHLRHFYSMLHPSAWLWTEMEKTEDLLRSDDAFERRLSETSVCNNPCVLQLGGNNLKELQTCIHMVSSTYQHYDEINLNCGCPSVETGGSQYGAALMKDPILTRNLLASMREETKRSSSSSSSSSSKNHIIPISVKIRIAAHDTFNPNQEESYHDFINFVKQITNFDDDDNPQQNGMHVIVHARAAILSGLSPSKNRSAPPLKHSFVHQLAQDMPNLRITLNGGISSLNQLEAAIKQSQTANSPIDGIMAGRWLLRYPLDLLDIHHFMNQYDANLQTFNDNYCQNQPSLAQEKAAAILSYGEYAYQQLKQGVYSKSDILSPLCLVAFQLQEQMSILDDKFDSLDDTEDISKLRIEDDCMDVLQVALYDAVTSAIENDDMNRRKKSDDNKSVKAVLKAFQRALGKKVFNKLKKNRNEI